MDTRARRDRVDRQPVVPMLRQLDLNRGEHISPHPSGPSPRPDSAGPDAVWFVEILADRAGRITADGKVEEFQLPAGSKPHAVVATADGGCWITLWAAGSLARLDAEGNITEQVALGEGSEPHGLALDHDSVWVALEKGSLVHLEG